MVDGPAILHPPIVAPVIGEVPHDRRLPWRSLRVRRERVRLVDAGTRDLRVDGLLLQSAMPHGGDEAYPDPRFLPRIQAVGELVRAVELTDHAHRLRVR